MKRLRKSLFLLLLLVVRAAPSFAALDLHDAQTLTLDNGMTVILLEDRNFPVVSVQVIYRVGARNETTGKTGLAHFLEHMAFRATEHFPDTEVVSRIYAVGGEWHGYTWIDQTTYFATVPREHWPLLLEIEADRMLRLKIDPATIEAEKGAVLAEMHMYETSPSSMLVDTLAFTSFLAHPYRNNTIGWQRDVESFTVEDVRSFYEAHYHPANAVLAVVGDADMSEVRAKIEALFGRADRRPVTPLPHTEEPPQTGVRRAVIGGPSAGHEFRIGYRAPSVRHPDFAAFLVLQELLSGSSGVNFLQNDWGTPVRAGRLLDGAAPGLTTWFPPSAQAYLFTIGGNIGADGDEAKTEAAIEAAVASLRSRAPDEAAVAAAVDVVLDELVFDIETTEDAAHQLASFASFGALDELKRLPDRLRQVSGEDLARVARRWLRPGQRTIAWYRQQAMPVDDDRESAPPKESAPLQKPGAIDETPAAGPVLRRLESGLPVIVIRSDLSPSVYLKVVAPGIETEGGGLVSGDPDPGYLSWGARGRADELPALAERAADALKQARHARSPASPASLDPATRLYEEMRDLMSAGEAEHGEPVAPSLIVVAGDVGVDDAIDVLETVFGTMPIGSRGRVKAAETLRAERINVSLPVPVVQSQLGYLVMAPAPRDPDFDAWRILQYIFAHDYEGRFGKAAISERGLAYFVDAGYLSSSNAGWTRLAVGVDPDKLEPLADLLEEELQRLDTEPPTEAEVAEAKRHLVGRMISASQGNEELADTAARRYLRHGEIVSPEVARRRLERVSVEDVVRLVPEFVRGVTVTLTGS